MAKQDESMQMIEVPVTVIEPRGEGAVLVEWVVDGDLRRAVVPVESLHAGHASAETLEMGVPFGVMWEKILTLHATPETLARALRANGLWTLGDIERNPQAAFGVLQSVYGVDLAALIRAAANSK